MANLTFWADLSYDRDAVDASLQIISGDISTMEQAIEQTFRLSFERGLVRRDRAHAATCCMSSDNVNIWLPCRMANLIFRVGLSSDRDSSADWCVWTVHMPSDQLRFSCGVSGWL